MAKWSKVLMFVVVIVFILGACSTDAPGSEEDNDKEANNDKVKVGLSISTLNNPFFVTLRDGAESAAEEAGFEIVTSDAQNDPSTQLSDIEDLIQQDIDVLLVNPVDSEAVVTAVESANQANIPVITVDRSSEGGEIVTHIASDNVAGGEIAGEFIAEQLGEEGKIVELEGISGSSAARERGEGFHNIMDELDGMEIVAKQTADFDRTKGLSVMENIIQGTKDIDALFAHNDEMALGAIEALESQNMLEDVVVVGFDATEDAVAAVSEGRMLATVAQQPKLIGEKAIDAAGKIVEGEELEEFIPVELELVTE
ncbi:MULTISPECIES: ribose ABC transporter substrate-binding protein RbsB [Virgibacillus]|uniref:D-ribose-binding periplasmic protein n=1 Tax=Virgibacillus dokdonensis TaxID=302167 RepID=A0A2K9J5B5_9BACI|nr:MULTISPECIES: ribose ABC transporter substrate-binding protein RbsB [Virgibacillus]AUJ25241.1 D-ribose-binding periplasmic protein precursor [Virgibacillus dokdonensis]NWO14815.1 ribose ABC transporter substrate-binding protein RbsB [Virgibacillus sp.]